MKRIDEDTLMAYLDGELGENETRNVEAYLAEHPADARLLDELRVGESLIQGAFDTALAEPLVALGRIRSRKLRTVPRGSAIGYVAAALAASLATLIVGGFAGYSALHSIINHQYQQLEQVRLRETVQRQQTLSQALEKEVSGVRVSWQNSDSGNHGYSSPTRTWRTASGQFCREFEETTTANGIRSAESGVACRTAQGLWKVRIRYYPE